MKQNNFCRALSNAVSFRIPGESNSITFNPCCLYDNYLPYHPTFFKKQRQQFIEADKTYLPGCSKCELKEKTHGAHLTQRTMFNREIPDGLNDTIYKLEIVLDTTCNAACIQCGTEQSSLWRNEMAQRNHKYIHIQPESQIDSKIELIKKNIDLQQVKIFHFWGGEPLLTDTHLKFLRQIEDLSTVKLAYTSNGSIFPDDEVLDLWSKCKEVSIGLSMDGIEDRFHYIRWPIKWNKWQQNVKRFKNETSGNVDIHVNYCVIPLNALYTDEVDEWLYANLNQYTNFIRGEGTLDIARTPMSLREEVWKRLGDNHTVSSILKKLPVRPVDHMIAYLDEWDPIRKLDWRKTFPDVSKHFK